MTLKSDDVSTRFEPLLGEKLVGTRHAEDGRLYAILKDGDSTREEPVDLFPFADVQVGPNCEFGRRITAVAVEYDPALLRGRSRLPALSMTRRGAWGSAERKERRT